MKYPPLPDGIIIDGRRVFTSFNMRDYAITFHNINTEILHKLSNDSCNDSCNDSRNDSNTKVVNDLLKMFKGK